MQGELPGIFPWCLGRDRNVCIRHFAFSFLEVPQFYSKKFEGTTVQYTSKTIEGSSPNYPLHDRANFSQTYTGATIPLNRLVEQSIL